MTSTLYIQHRVVCRGIPGQVKSKDAGLILVASDKEFPCFMLHDILQPSVMGSTTSQLLLVPYFLLVRAYCVRCNLGQNCGHGGV